MVTVGQNLIVVTATVIASLLLMTVLNRAWPRENRFKEHDLIGWQLSILGTTYAVILSFMLYTVWTTFEEADLNVDIEADAVLNTYRLAAGFPEPQRTELQTLTRSYVEAVINQDWLEMARGKAPTRSAGIDNEMWNTVMSVRTTSAGEPTAEDHALSELSSLSQHRLTRTLQGATRLPDVLWYVLLRGGALTIVAACTFGEALRIENWIRGQDKSSKIVRQGPPFFSRA
jgi:hypothetical protein